MGRKSGITVGGYHPRIHHMQWVMGQREWNTFQMEKAMNKKKMRAMYWTQRLANALFQIRCFDPIGWEAWFDDDNNVPADSTNKDMALLIEDRVRVLIGRYPKHIARACRNIFIWTDEFGVVYVYSKEEGKDPLYAHEFKSIDEAETFLRGLPFRNIEYGVVLDILPVQAMGK